MPSRFQDLLKGFRSNLKFTNRFQLVFNRLFRRNLPLAHYVWKDKFVFTCNTGLGDHISVQECFAERAYDLLLGQCNFPSNQITYVNVGANVGAFDVLLVERGLEIEAGLAVELNPLTFSRCLANLQTNGLRSTKLINAAVGGANGRVQFQPSGCSLGDSIFAVPSDGAGGSVEVDVLTIETLLEKHTRHFPRFDLLKLDCEGAEYAIIRISPPAVLRKFRYIIAEFHPEPKGESVVAAYAALKDAGFRSLRAQPGEFRFTDLFVRS